MIKNNSRLIMKIATKILLFAVLLSSLALCSEKEQNQVKNRREYLVVNSWVYMSEGPDISYDSERLRFGYILKLIDDKCVTSKYGDKYYKFKVINVPNMSLHVTSSKLKEGDQGYITQVYIESSLKALSQNAKASFKDRCIEEKSERLIASGDVSFLDTKFNEVGELRKGDVIFPLSLINDKTGIYLRFVFTQVSQNDKNRWSNFISTGVTKNFVVKLDDLFEKSRSISKISELLNYEPVASNSYAITDRNLFADGLLLVGRKYRDIYSKLYQGDVLEFTGSILQNNERTYYEFIVKESIVEEVKNMKLIVANETVGSEVVYKHKFCVSTKEIHSSPG
jgi:hypothetical protein